MPDIAAALARAANWPVFSGDSLVSALESALIVTLIGAFVSLLSSPVADSMTREVRDPHHELIGQGLGNSGSDWATRSPACSLDCPEPQPC